MMRMRIRPMRAADAGAVAALTSQWGTPSPQRRPPRAWTPIAARPEHAAFVAC